MSLAIWDHTVLPATRHKWTHPALTPAVQAGTRFTYPGGMEGWVDLVDLIAPRPEVEPVTFRSRVQRSTNATTKTTVYLMHITPMLLSAKSVNSSSFSYSMFTAPEQSIETQKVIILLWTSSGASGSTYKMSNYAVASFFEVVVGLHSQNRLIAGLF